MSNIALVWDSQNARGDWQIADGRTATGHVLRSAVLISLFTDRRAEPDYQGDDRHGWWMDTFDGVLIGSRLWQLRRRKIADRPALIQEATDMAQEALQWLLDNNIASAISIVVTAPLPRGSLLQFEIAIAQPTGAAPVIRALWRAA